MLRASLDVTIEVEIARPPSVVWSFLNDIERLPEWIEEFESVRKESAGPTGLGTIVHYTLEQGHRAGTYEVVEWEPERMAAWDGPPVRWVAGAMRPRGSHELRDLDNGHTLLVSRYQPELSGAQVLLRPYLRRWLRRARVASAEMLRQLIESE